MNVKNMRTEFFGLPGCGKTYLVEKITGIDRNRITKKATTPLILFVKKLSRFSPISLYYRFRIKKIIGNDKLRFVFHSTNIDEMIDSIVLVASAYKMKISPNGVLDEGIIQRVVSLGVNYNLDKKDIFNIITIFRNLLFDTEVIFVKISVYEAYDAIKERNRKESKMDFFDESTLLQYLQNYKEICEDISEKFGFTVIQRSQFPYFIKERELR